MPDAGAGKAAGGAGARSRSRTLLRSRGALPRLDDSATTELVALLTGAQLDDLLDLLVREGPNGADAELLATLRVYVDRRGPCELGWAPDALWKSSRAAGGPVWAVPRVGLAVTGGSSVLTNSVRGAEIGSCMLASDRWSSCSRS